MLPKPYPFALDDSTYVRILRFNFFLRDIFIVITINPHSHPNVKSDKEYIPLIIYGGSNAVPHTTPGTWRDYPIYMFTVSYGAFRKNSLYPAIRKTVLLTFGIIIRDNGTQRVYKAICIKR